MTRVTLLPIASMRLRTIAHPRHLTANNATNNLRVQAVPDLELYT